MAKFNPDFWEVTIASESWDAMPSERRLWHALPEEVASRHERQQRAAGLMPELLAIMDQVLTGRQREVVQFFFIEELNQREIAERLGITQQSVSEHLYGKIRNGHSVGGALRKLREACQARGIRWEP
jgi:RNA polymerase sigma factor (sigma-70 family)